MLRTLSPSLRLSTLATALAALWLVASGVTCAAGNQGLGGAGTTSSTGAMSASTAATTGGGGGASTTTTTTTSVGPSTVSSTTSSSSAASTSSTSASSSSGVVPAPSTIVTIQESSLIIGEYDNVVSMMGFSTPWEDFSQDPIGLAFTGNGAGVAVFRSLLMVDGGPSVGELRFARYTGSWTPGFGGALMPVQPSPPLYIVGGASVAGSSIRAHSAFQGTDMKFYYAEYFNGSWSPTSEPMTGGAMQSTGPVPPAIATLNDVPIAAFIGDDGNLYDQTRTGTAMWQAPNGHGVAGTAASITPSIIALPQSPTSTAELLIVYVSTTANALEYTIRTAGVWSTPAPIVGPSSNDPLALAPIAAGGAVLSYKGTDANLYTTVLSASSPYTWSTVAQGVMGATPMLLSPPAVATGAKGADAELLYLEGPSYITYAARMTNGAWGPALMAGSASYHVAVGTGD